MTDRFMDGHGPLLWNVIYNGVLKLERPENVCVCIGMIPIDLLAKERKFRLKTSLPGFQAVSNTKNPVLRKSSSQETRITSQYS